MASSLSEHPLVFTSFFTDCIFILPAESLRIKQLQPLETSVSWQSSHSWKERLLQDYLNTQVHFYIVCFSFCLFFLGIFPFLQKILNYLTCILYACIKNVWLCRVSNYPLNKNPIKCKFKKKIPQVSIFIHVPATCVNPRGAEPQLFGKQRIWCIAFYRVFATEWNPSSQSVTETRTQYSPTAFTSQCRKFIRKDRKLSLHYCALCFL